MKTNAWGFELARQWKHRWLNHPALDYLAPLAVVAGSVLFGAGLTSGADPGSRHVWYQTLSTVLAGLLGVSITAATILWAMTPGPRLRRVAAAVGPRLSRLYFSSVFALVFASIAVAIAIPLDRSLEANWAATAVEAIVALSVLRVLRLLWLFGRMLAAIAEDRRDDSEAEQWTKPVISDDDYPVEVRH